MAKRTAAGTLALAVCLSGGIAFAGAANAALPATNGALVTPTTAPAIVPGVNGQAASDLSFALGDVAWAKGDRILLELPSGTGVSFGALPTVSVESKIEAGVTYAPTMMVSKVPAASSGPERIAITFTNSSPKTTTAPSLTLKISGIKLDVATNAVLGNVAVAVSGQVADNSQSSGYQPAVAYDAADVIAAVGNVSFDAPTASFEGTGTKLGTLPTMTITEAKADAFGAGAITINLSSGVVSTTADSSAKVTGSSATATVAASAQSITVTPTGLSATAIETITITGVKYDAPTSGSVTTSLVAGGAIATGQTSPNKLVAYPTITRQAGEDRYGTAEQIADQLLGGGDAADIVLTNGGLGTATGVSIDALSAAYLASSFAADAPILLTDTNKLPSATRTALLKAKAATGTTVHILGGETVVSNAVKEELESLGFITTRVNGTNRYDSAADAAVRVGAAAVGSYDQDGSGAAVHASLKTAILASGSSPADALAAGQVSYDASLPILLTEQSSVPQETLDAIETLGIKQVIIVGGEAVVSKTVETQLDKIGVKIKRVAGADRYETAAELIKLGEASTTTGGLGQVYTTGTAIYLANGFALADASVAAPLAASGNAGLLFTDKSGLPKSTKALVQASSTLTTVVGVGGTSVLPAAGLIETNVTANSNTAAAAPVPAVKATGTIQGISLSADAAGVAGNGISVTLATRAANTTADVISVSVAGDDITVLLADSSTDVVTSTQADVTAAIQAHTGAAALVDATGGTATLAVAGTVNLSGGVNAS